MFGGYTFGQDINDLFELDLNNLIWNRLDSYGTKPTAREGMTSVKHNKEMFIIGGCDVKEKECFKEIYLLNIDTLVWEKIVSPR